MRVLQSTKYVISRSRVRASSSHFNSVYLLLMYGKRDGDLKVEKVHVWLICMGTK